MWEEDGWSVSNIYEFINKESIYLTWMHQLDCCLICSSEKMRIKSTLKKKNDLGISIMPLGVSFELTDNGLPKRIGSRKAHIFGWFWGIPKNSPEQELAFKLARFITNKENHLRECQNFYLLSRRNDVSDALKENERKDWQSEVYTKSHEQFLINDDQFVPRFKTLELYQEFLEKYYNAFEHIVMKKRYSPPNAERRVDRNFIRENLK
jgi:ABC-type glycerol-3-phosphate transport system substrate-binding protein